MTKKISYFDKKILSYQNLKLIIDVFFSVFFLLIFIPLYILCIFLIFINMGKPIFFIQERGGYKNQVFKLIKFRTMSLETNENEELLSDNDRITKLGKFLRETSLDELPSVINVLKGEMSFVGPRPFIAKYINLYNEKQKQRHNVRPGITGWAQVSGRNKITWEEKFELDIWYVNNFSLYVDIKILLFTIITVVKKEGMNQSDKNTMDEFKGNK